MQIHENAVSDRFLIDYNEEQVTVRLHPECTGWLRVTLKDDAQETDRLSNVMESLHVTLQHDSETCLVHETEEA